MFFSICKSNVRTAHKYDTQFDKSYRINNIKCNVFNEDKDVPIHKVLFLLGTESEKREIKWFESLLHFLKKILPITCVMIILCLQKMLQKN